MVQNYNSDELIKKHRTANVELTVLKKDNTPLANQEITIEQLEHKFLFGCTGHQAVILANDDFMPEEKPKLEKSSQKWLELFNFVTLPFYWGRFEPERGKPRTKQLLNAAHWLQKRGFKIKGHPLCWHTVTAPWLLEMSNADILKAQIGRIKREVTDFKGLVDTWDVINEVVIMPVFDKYDNGITRLCKEIGQVGIVRATFEAARKANPKATLLINDFNISPAYEKLIEDCIKDGIKFDAIGIQSHMHQGYWGVEKTLDVLKRFSRFGIPLHFTESTIVSGKIMPKHIVDLNDHKVDEWPSTPEGEKRQAQEIATHYKTLFSHPAVEAITWWGLFDGGWLKAPAGLLRADHSVKPSYNALYELIKGKWWFAPKKIVTDNKGQITFNGFLGKYKASWKDEKTTFVLAKKGNDKLEVRL
ncbi:MAG: endo-1,4-beta-xylanase [Candidatus Ratteibacteria bacterium]|nr:endo-1,4-beta-xylanase [Candidatus Ratteibacteria bacterium]